jgi:hypothetical protein
MLFRTFQPMDHLSPKGVDVIKVFASKTNGDMIPMTQVSWYQYKSSDFIGEFRNRLNDHKLCLNKHMDRINKHMDRINKHMDRKTMLRLQVLASEGEWLAFSRHLL